MTNCWRMPFAQVAHAPELLAFGADAASTAADTSPQSYFAQVIDDPQLGLTDLYRNPPAVHQATLQQITENPQARTAAEGVESALRRRDRFLNHLLARFAEPLTDYTLLHAGLGAAGATPGQSGRRQRTLSPGVPSAQWRARWRL
ncbi:MAG: hypothetical protein R3E79_30490 [Caldilineaceae bacterium]